MHSALAVPIPAMRSLEFRNPTWPDPPWVKSRTETPWAAPSPPPTAHLLLPVPPVWFSGPGFLLGGAWCDPRGALGGDPGLCRRFYGHQHTSHGSCGMWGKQRWWLHGTPCSNMFCCSEKNMAETEIAFYPKPLRFWGTHRVGKKSSWIPFCWFQG